MSKHFEKYSGLMLGRLALSCLIICVFSAAHAEEKLVHLEAEERPVVVNLESATDEQIGVLLQRWPQLDAPQRRDLLAEVRKRMRSASQIQEGQATSAIHNKTPSLTLRIKRAQTQHGFGRTAPRGEAGDSDGQTVAAQNGQQDVQRPRELVIRTTVTQILPDGRRVTRQKTLLPSSLRAQMERQGGSEDLYVGLSAESPALPDPQQRPPGKMTVRRTTVRFGTGFNRRHQVAGAPASVQADVRRVSSPEVLVIPSEVRVSVPVTTDAKKTN